MWNHVVTLGALALVCLSATGAALPEWIREHPLDHQVGTVTIASEDDAFGEEGSDCDKVTVSESTTGLRIEYPWAVDSDPLENPGSFGGPCKVP